MLPLRNPKIECREHYQESGPVRLSPNEKLVLLVRHGEGTHNLIASQFDNHCECRTGGPQCVYKNQELTDAQLTLKGKRQACAVAPHILRQYHHLGDNFGPSDISHPEICFVSPLTRTLQTATIAFSQTNRLKVPMVASELIREQHGKHWCDKRSPISELKQGFGHVDFGDFKVNEDGLFDPVVREADEEVAKRSHEFFSGLYEMDKKSIVLVAHSAFFRHTLSKALVTPNPNVARQFQTGECRSVVLRYC